MRTNMFLYDSRVTSQSLRTRYASAFGPRAISSVIALLGFSVSLLLGHAAVAGEEITITPLTATARLQPSTVEAGGTAELLIEMQLASKHKAYVDKFKLEIEAPSEIKLDKFRLAPIVQFMDTFSKKMKEGVQDKATMRAVIEIPPGFKPGDVNSKFKLTFQACTKEHCLFPKSITLDVPFKVIGSVAGSSSSGPSAGLPAVAAPSDGAASVGAAASATAAGAAEPAVATAPIAQDSGSQIENAMKNNVFLAIALMFGFGFLTSLTPCIYPMIPITLAVLGARTKGQSKAKSFAISLSYVLGLAVTYSIMGVMAAKTGAMFGSALGNVYIVTGIACLFVFMGLSMYGLFELQVPAGLRDRLGSSKGGSGFGGAFATGLVAGVVASPCVGPVLVGALTYIAQSQDVVLGFVTLFAFAMGMGVLFIVLGTSSALISKVPKAGAWMEVVKFAFGTIMVGMALYYIKPVYPVWLFQLLTGIAVILIASAYGAFEPASELSGSGRVRKGAAIAAFVLGLTFALSGFSQKAGLALPGASLVAANGAASGADGYQKLDWKPYSDQALADALKAGQPVILDFFAEWCGACKELEHYTFTDPRIRDLSKKFALLKIDATEDFPGLEKLKTEYKVVGLPTMVFFDGGGKRRTDLTVTGFEDADKFFSRMTSVAGSNEKPHEISQSSTSDK